MNKPNINSLTLLLVVTIFATSFMFKPGLLLKLRISTCGHVLLENNFVTVSILSASISCPEKSTSFGGYPKKFLIFKLARVWKLIVIELVWFVFFFYWELVFSGCAVLYLSYVWQGGKKANTNLKDSTIQNTGCQVSPRCFDW